jgi:hypothetical protein
MAGMRLSPARQQDQLADIGCLCSPGQRLDLLGSARERRDREIGNIGGLTPSSANAQVSGLPIERDGRIARSLADGKTFFVSDLTMRLPVLPVDPMTRMGAVFI